MILVRVILRDLRRSALLIAGVLVLDFLAMYGDRADWLHPQVAVWLVRLLMLAIGAEVVFGDPVSGNLAQWRTRPVSGASMALGKTLMLGLVAFGVGGAMLASELLFGAEMWPGLTLGLWQVFSAALWVLLGAALASLVETPRGFLIHAAVTMIASTSAVALALFLARSSQWMAAFVTRGAKENGRAVMLAGVLSMIFAFAAVSRRYMWPHRVWTARGLAWLACLFVLGHEGLVLLLGR